jgi:carbonic anhydrase
MQNARPLPPYLIQRYHGWKATSYTENESWYRTLAQEGQHPRAMLISCCDSRVHVTSIFGADQGEFFIHRNIANLVPPYTIDGGQHGTSAALEYAVCELRVAHVIIMGHSSCGGIKGCDEMCSGRAPAMDEPNSFVGRWMDILRPGHARVAHIENDDERTRALEKEAVLVSLENLTSFPFVTAAMRKSTLTLHGLWLDIGEGRVEQYSAATRQFAPI